MTHLTKIVRGGSWRKPRRPAVVAGVSVAALAAVLAGVAIAADTRVTLTASGPNPATVTVNVGDSVTFTNNDTVNHSIVTKTPSGYAPGGFVSPVIKPGETYSVGLQTPGTISYTETGFGRSHRGTIVVGVAGTLTISSKQKTVLYGDSITITGTTPLAGTDVTVTARVKGQHGSGKKAWQPVTTVHSAGDGSFSATVTPTTATTYRAEAAAGQVTSPMTVAVSVAPRLTLRATTARVVRNGKLVTLVAKILPANGAQTIQLIGYDTSRRAWRNVATKPVSSSGTAVFRFRVPYGQTALRVTVSKSDHLLTGLLKTASTQSVVVRGTGPVPATTSGKHHKRKGH